MGYVDELRKLVGQRPLILVGAVVIIESEGYILLQKRNEMGERWGLIGGLMELGESTEQTAHREVFEEAGLKVEQLSLVGVFSGPDCFVQAPNGDEFFIVTVAYVSDNYSGDLSIRDQESLAFRFFNLCDLPVNMAGSHRKIVEQYRNMRS